MIKRFLYTLLLCIVLLFNSDAYAGGNDTIDGKSFIWKVKSDIATAYILGSVHVMKKESYPLKSKIETAFDKSQVLVVEADINNISQSGLSEFLTKAFYSGNDSLDKHVSKETFDLVMNEADRLGMDHSVFLIQKPWFIAVSLEAFELMRMGFDPDYGLDKHFLTEATGKKKILELESIDDQLALLSGLADNEQDAFLKYTIKSSKKMEKMLDMLLDSWNNGDEKGMETMMFADSENDTGLSVFYDKLIIKRNMAMELKIENMLKNKESFFIVIGAGHLVGEKGVIELLRKKGYSVEQL